MGSLMMDTWSEDVVDFNIWVGELELLVGSSKGKALDARACFELLTSMHMSLDRSGKAAIVGHQKKCEDILYRILDKGARPPVRRLVASCLCKLYHKGDNISLYSRHSELQGKLGSLKDKSDLSVRLGVIECLAALARAHGAQLGGALTETVALASKHTRAQEPLARRAALGLLAGAVQGSGDARGAAAAHTEALKALDRASKDKSELVRTGAAGVIAAVARAGGAGLWIKGGGAFDDALQCCFRGLEDPGHEVREAYATALGHLAAAARHPAAAAAAEVEKSSSKKAALQKLLAGALRASLIRPFQGSVAGSTKLLCMGLAGAWVTYLHALQPMVPEEEFVGVVMQAVEMLGRAEWPEGSLVLDRDELGALRGSREGLGGGGGAAAQQPGQAAVDLTSTNAAPIAQACCLYILQVGAVERLGEAGQILVLQRLTALVERVAAGYTPSAGPPLVVALRASADVLATLGEVPREVAEGALGPLQLALAAPHETAREQAGRALAALALAHPAVASRLLDGAVEAASVAREMLASALGGRPAAGVVRGQLNILRGQSAALSALLVEVKALPLGVTSRLPLAALDIATLLVRARPAREGSRVAHTLAAHEREAGWRLMAALVAALPREVVAGREMEFVALWEPAIGAESMAALGQWSGGAPSHLVDQLRWRAAALEALSTFITHPLTAAAAERGDVAELLGAVVGMLATGLEAMRSCPPLREPPPGAAPAVMLLNLRLLEAFGALRDPTAYPHLHSHLLAHCMMPLRDPTSTSIHAADVSLLRHVLDPSDDTLGPWATAKDPLQEELLALTGGVDCPPPPAWRGRRGGAGASGEGVEGVPWWVSAGEGPFPQPLPLETLLLDAQIGLLGDVLAALQPASQIKVAQLLVDTAAAVVAGGQGKKQPRALARKQAALVGTCAAALAGLKQMPARGAPPALAHKMVELGELALAEAAHDFALLRAAGELHAQAARVTDNDAASAAARALAAQVGSCPKDAPAFLRAGLCLALGGVHRAVGGMALSTEVKGTVVALQSALRDCASTVGAGWAMLWALHALWLTANAAGLSYVPYAKYTLHVSMELLLSDGLANSPVLRQTVGRIANAMVAVLGPELAPGSAHFAACRALVSEVGSVDEPSAQLERVLYAQQLVLFAPHAVPPANHVPMLRSTLRSRKPALRAAAIATLHHLAEASPDALEGSRLEEDLFSLLDRESSPAIAAEARQTLEVLLACECERAPGKWLRLCGMIALGPGSAGSGGGGGGEGGEGGDSDDDEGGGGESGESSAGAGGVGKGGASPPLGQERWRWRTRMLSAECLASIPALVGSDPCSLDLEAARAAARSRGGDYLVLHLQQLIDLGFKMSTGGVEGLRPLGLRLLRCTVSRFLPVEDPDVPGHPILEQYQAQLVSTLRSALASGAPPTMAFPGAALAADFVEGGLAWGDAGVLRRVVHLLLAPLGAEEWAATEHAERAEWVGARVRVALLEALARCACFAHAPRRGGGGEAVEAAAREQEAVGELLRPHLGTLLRRWCDLLGDYVVMSTQQPHVQALHAPALFTSRSPSVAEQIRTYFDNAWQAVMGAATSSAALLAREGGELLSPEDYDRLMGVAQLAMCESALPTYLDDSSGGGDDVSAPGWAGRGPPGSGEGAAAAAGTEAGAAGGRRRPGHVPAAGPRGMFLFGLEAAGRIVVGRPHFGVYPSPFSEDGGGGSGGGAGDAPGPSPFCSPGRLSIDRLREILLQLRAAVLQPPLARTPVGGVVARPAAPGESAALSAAAAAAMVEAVAGAVPAGWWADDASLRDAAVGAAAACTSRLCPDPAAGMPPEVEAAYSRAVRGNLEVLRRSRVVGLHTVMPHEMARAVKAMQALPPGPALDAVAALVGGGLDIEAGEGGGRWISMRATLAEGVALALAPRVAALSRGGGASGVEALPAHLSALLAAGRALAGAGAAPGGAGLGACFSALRGAFAEEAAEGAGAAGMAALTRELQAAAGSPERTAWALRLLSEVGGDASSAVRARLAAPGGPEGVAAGVQGLKLLLLAQAFVASANGSAGPAGAGAITEVLVSLLIEAAAPEARAPHPALAEAAVRILTHLASKGGAEFRGAVAALSPASKQRLQAALRASGSGGAGGGAAGASAPGAPGSARGLAPPPPPPGPGRVGGLAPPPPGGRIALKPTFGFPKP